MVSLILLFLLSNGLLADAIISNVPASQVSALSDLFYSTNGPYWFWRNSYFGEIWNFSGIEVNPCSNWQGITCLETFPNSSTGLITSLKLPGYGLVGRIPDTISGLVNLSFLILYNNSISGPIPSIQNLTQLQLVDMWFNQLSSSIPYDLFDNLCNISSISFSLNQITGYLPEFLKYRNPRLLKLDFSYNRIAGTLPESISYLDSLESLDFYQNLLSGTIPNLFSKLKSLQILGLDNNQLSGSMPNNIGDMQSLTNLNLNQNSLSGPIPPSIGNLSNLLYFSAFTNQLSKQIPDEIANCLELIQLSLDGNFFTGTIPAKLGTVPNLQELDLYYTYISGSVPKEFARLSELRLLLLQGTLLSGTLSGAFNFSAQKHLLTVDVSMNYFTGTLPTTVFGPSLVQFSAFQTCFEGTIPAEICRSKSLEILYIDGLTSFSSCAKKFFPFYSDSVRSTRPVPGGLPGCIWKELMNLTTLHASGNGLSGTIPSLASYMNLSSLDLSYNRFSGSIPPTLQSSSSLQYFNLQSNKFHGSIEHTRFLDFSDDAHSSSGITLYLSNNRLSGIIPWTLYNAENLEILDCNLFSCSATHQPPIHDPINQDYICGSNMLNMTMFLFAACGGLLVLGIATMCFLGYRGFYSDQSFNGRLQNIKTEHVGIVMKVRLIYRLFVQWATSTVHSFRTATSSYFEQLTKGMLLLVYWRQVAATLQGSIGSSEMDMPANVMNLKYFLKTLNSLRNLSGILLLFVLLVSIPGYWGLKTSSYGTYADQYQWFLSGVFLSGWAPAIFVIVLWFACLVIICTWLVNYIHRVPPKGDSQADPPVSESPSTSVDAASTESIETIETALTYQHPSLYRGESEFLAPHLEEEKKKVVSQRNAKSSAFMTQTQEFAAAMVALLFNVLIVLTIKATCIYILVSLNVPFMQKILLEVALSIVDVLWDLALIPFVIKRLRRSGATGKMKIKVYMLFFNSIFAPMFAIAFSDASCFNGILVKTPSVKLSSSFENCLVYGLHGNMTAPTCLYYKYWQNSASFVSPFFYNWNCYSTIAVEYIPIFLLSSSLMILLMPWVLVLVLSRQSRSKLFDLLPGICWIDRIRVIDMTSNDRKVLPLPRMLQLSEMAFNSKDTSSILLATTNAQSLVDTKLSPLHGSAVHSSVVEKESAESICAASSKSVEDTRTVIPKSFTAVPRASSRIEQLFFPSFVLATLVHHILFLISFGLLSPVLAVAIITCSYISTVTYEVLIGRYLACSPYCRPIVSESSLRRHDSSASSVRNDVAISTDAVGSSRTHQLCDDDDDASRMVAQLGRGGGASARALAGEESYRRRSTESVDYALYSRFVAAVRYNSRINAVQSSSTGNGSIFVSSYPTPPTPATSNNNNSSSRWDSHSADHVISGEDARSSSYFPPPPPQPSCDDIYDPTGGLDALCHHVSYSPRKCLWIVICGSAAFIAIITYDMVGDSVGWVQALWAPAIVLFLATVLLVVMSVFFSIDPTRQSKTRKWFAELKQLFQSQAKSDEHDNKSVHGRKSEANGSSTDRRRSTIGTSNSDSNKDCDYNSDDGPDEELVNSGIERTSSRKSWSALLFRKSEFPVDDSSSAASRTVSTVSTVQMQRRSRNFSHRGSAAPVDNFRESTQSLDSSSESVA